MPDLPQAGTVVALRARVLSHAAANAEYRHLVLAAPAPASDARPGQFFQLLCPAPPGEAPFLRRPMSVYAADPARGEIGFLYKGESDQGKEKKVDFKAWFKAFHTDAAHLNDHVITA